MTEPFPYPQTLGRTREIHTVEPYPNRAELARPTQTEATSLFTQSASYVNNWLANLTQSNQVKDQQSLEKAGKVSGGEPVTFETIADTFARSARTMKTYADDLLESFGYRVSRVDPGAKVPGRPVAPRTVHYQNPNLIDQKVADIKQAGQAFVDQVKGLFNKAYEGPREPQAVVASDIGITEQNAQWLFMGALLIVLLAS